MTLTLVTGGVRSGKSRYAEALLRTAPVVRYVAPLVDAGDDPEWVRRVQAHRLRRPAGWVTVEGPDVAAAVRRAAEPVVVDCLGTWVTALVDRAQAVAHVFKLARAGFSQRRKQLINTLSTGVGLSKIDAAELLLKAKVEPSRRPETLTVAEWIRLSQVYLAFTPSEGAG